MKRNPLLIVSALLAGLAPLVGNGLYAGPDGTGQSRLDTMRDGLPGVASVAVTLELVGFLATCVLVAWLTQHLYTRSPVAAVTTAIGGAATLAVKVGSAAPMMVVADQADRLDARTADLLFGLNDAAFVLNGLFLGFTLAAAGLGLLRTPAPRWLGWWPAVGGVLSVVAAVVAVATPAEYVPIPFLLLLVWMIALAISSAMGAAEARREMPSLPTVAPDTARQ